jgi:hypothetical protein
MIRQATKDSERVVAQHISSLIAMTLQFKFLLSRYRLPRRIGCISAGNRAIAKGSNRFLAPLLALAPFLARRNTCAGPIRAD